MEEALWRSYNGGYTDVSSADVFPATVMFKRGVTLGWTYLQNVPVVIMLWLFKMIKCASNFLPFTVSLLTNHISPGY